MAAQDEEEVLYNKEKNLGVTTFTFRSKRYSFPSVIVKSDIQTEGVCVMLDVGLFCPFCSGNFKTKYMHKKSRLSISQKTTNPCDAVPGSPYKQLQQQQLCDTISVSQGQRGDDSQGHPFESSKSSGYFNSSGNEFHRDSRGASDSVAEFFDDDPDSGSKRRSLDKGVHLAKPDLSILNVLEIEDSETLDKPNSTSTTKEVDGTNTIKPSTKMRDFKADVSITKPHIVVKDFGGLGECVEHVEVTRVDKEEAVSSVRSITCITEGHQDKFVLSGEKRDVLNDAFNGERDMSTQRATPLPPQTSHYVPRAERERLLNQGPGKQQPFFSGRRSPKGKMTSQPRGNNTRPPKEEDNPQKPAFTSSLLMVKPLKILAATVLNTDHRCVEEFIREKTHIGETMEDKLPHLSAGVESGAACYYYSPEEDGDEGGHMVNYELQKKKKKNKPKSTERSQCALGSVSVLETRHSQPLNDDQFERTDNNGQNNYYYQNYHYNQVVFTDREPVKEDQHNKQDHSKPIMAVNSSGGSGYSNNKYGNPGITLMSKDSVSANIDRGTVCVQSGPENLNTNTSSVVVDNRGVNRSSVVISSAEKEAWQGHNKGISVTPPRNGGGSTNRITSLDQGRRINSLVNNNKSDQSIDHQGGVRVQEQPQRRPVSDQHCHYGDTPLTQWNITPQVKSDSYFEELLLGGGSSSSRDYAGGTTYHHSADRLYAYDETSSEASSVHQFDDTVLLQSAAYGSSSRDTLLLTDELLTDDITSGEEESYRHIDAETLKTIEKKLLENLAKLDVCERKLDLEGKEEEKDDMNNKNKTTAKKLLQTPGDKESLERTVLDTENVLNRESIATDNGICQQSKTTAIQLQTPVNEVSLEKDTALLNVVLNRESTSVPVPDNNKEQNHTITDNDGTCPTKSGYKERRDGVLIGVSPSSFSSVDTNNRQDQQVGLVQRVHHKQEQSGGIRRETESVLDTSNTVVYYTGDKEGPVPSGQEMYERAFDILVDDDKGGGGGRGGMEMEIEIPCQEDNGCSSSRRPPSHQPAVNKGCCGSYSPEEMMERILDELEDESETYSGDATLGRVFSVRREKFIKPVQDNFDHDRGLLTKESEDIGEIYQFMKNLNNNVDIVDKDVDQKSTNATVTANNNTCYGSTKKSVSLNDLLDEEILCAKDLNETFNTVERGASLVEHESEGLYKEDLNETLTTLDDSVFSSCSPKYRKPLVIDEMFENAFEHALEDENDERDVKSWTSDYESDVRGSNDTSQSTSLDKHAGSVKIYEQYVNGLEHSKERKSRQTLSMECTVSERNQSVVSETSSFCDDNAEPLSRDPKASLSSMSMSSNVESEHGPAVSDIVAQINKLTADKIDGKQNIHRAPTSRPNKSKHEVVVRDELNIQTELEHHVVTQEEFFHTPESVCAPKSPTIVQRPQVSMAKMHKIPLLSSVEDLKDAEIFKRKPEPVKSKDEITMHTNACSSPPSRTSNIPPFSRQLSVDEMSEGSTMSSIDEFIPETEEYNAPPEVMEEAYYAAIEVAQMFQRHHIQHPCFQKIIEEISSSRESLVKSESDGTRVNTLKRKPLAGKSKIDEAAPTEEQHKSEGQEDVLPRDSSKRDVSDQMAVVTSDKDKQQFLQQLFGSSHTEHQQKHTEVQEICRSCEVKSDEDVTVKSEEVSTQEVTLIFAWPKRKGKMLPKGLAPNPYKELHMHRVMKVSDLDVEILEGPTLKSIKNVSLEQKSLTQSEDSEKDSLASQSRQLTDTDSPETSGIKQDIPCDQETPGSHLMSPIIADVDVKVKTTKFEPQAETLIIERQTSTEKKTVENITANIVKLLSENNTVEVNDNAQQLSLQYKEERHMDSLQDVMFQCTVEDITLYAETFFDLVFYDAVEVAHGLLNCHEPYDAWDMFDPLYSVENTMYHQQPETGSGIAYNLELDLVSLGSKNNVSLDSRIKSAASTEDSISNTEDEMSLVALDILENTEHPATGYKCIEDNVASGQNAQHRESSLKQGSSTFLSEQQPEKTYTDLEVPTVSTGRMYSSLQDLGQLSKPKARQKQLSLSDTLLEHTEIEVRRATSFDEITSIIDDCALTLENSLRTSGELLLKSPENTPDENNINSADNSQTVPPLETIHEGTTKVSKKPVPPAKPKPKLDSLSLSSSKLRRPDKSPPLTPNKKIPPPVKPKPNAWSKDMARSVSDGNINCNTSDMDPTTVPIKFSTWTGDRTPPPVKPKSNFDITGFVRSTSEDSFNLPISRGQPQEPAISRMSSSVLRGKSTTPPPVKPKPSTLPPKKPGKNNASDTNANFMLSLDELKPVDQQINHDSGTENKDACILDKPDQLNRNYKACTVSNNACAHCKSSASTECLHCGHACADNNIHVGQLKDTNSLYPTGNKVSCEKSQTQESVAVEDIQMEIDKFIEELTVMCHSPEKLITQSTKPTDHGSDPFTDSNLSEAVLQIESCEGVKQPRTPYTKTSGSQLGTATIPNKTKKHDGDMYTDVKPRVHMLPLTQHSGIQVQETNKTSGNICSNKALIKKSNKVYRELLGKYTDIFLDYTMQMAWLDLTESFAQKERSTTLEMAAEYTTTEVELYASTLVNDALDSVIEALGKTDTIETVSEMSTEIRASASTDRCSSGSHGQLDDHSCFPHVREMSQSYNENLETLPVKGNLNTLSSSEPVIIWDNDTSSFKWEKTQSNPVFGEPSQTLGSHPAYFVSESSTLTIHDSSQTLTMSQSQDTLLQSGHLPKYYDSISSSCGYPDSSKSHSPKSTQSPTPLDGSSCYTSVSQQLCSTPSSSVSDDLDTSGSMSTLDELVELNKAILENREIIRKHEDFLKETESIGKFVEANNNSNTVTDRTGHKECEDSGGSGLTDNAKYSLYRTSLEVYVDRSILDSPHQNHSQKIRYEDILSENTAGVTACQDTEEAKRCPNYSRRQNKVYQKSLRVEHLRRESDVSTESDIDYSEFKTYITDDLIKTDIDGAEVAQYSSSPFYYSGRDNVSVGSEVLKASSSTGQSSPATDGIIGQCSFATTMSGEASFSEDPNEYSSFHESQFDSSEAGDSSFAFVNKQFRELNKALDTALVPSSGIDDNEQCDEVKYIVEFKAKSPQTLCTVAKRPRVLVRAKTWDNVYSNPGEHSSGDSMLKSIISHHSVTLSPSFSPTSSSAFNVRDDDYAKQSRLFLNQKASDISGIVSRQDDVDASLHNIDSHFVSIGDKLSEARKQLSRSTEKLRSLSVDAPYYRVPHKEKWSSLDSEPPDKGREPVRLPRSLSWDVPGAEGRSFISQRLESRGQMVHDRKTDGKGTKESPPHPSQVSKTVYTFRRHSTGDIVGHSDDEQVSGVEGSNVVGKPPVVPRKSSKYSRLK